MDKLTTLRSQFQILQSVVGVLIFFAGLPQCARASSLEDGGRALAHKVVAALHGASVTYEQRNLSSLSAPEFFNLGTAFRDELQRGGMKILPRDGAASIVLTVSVNPAGYLGVAQIVREGQTEIFIESLGSIADGSFGETQPMFTLAKEFLFGQDDPMLDVVLAQDAKRADVLGTQSISSYERQDDHWKFSYSARLPVRRNSAHELRGLQEIDLDFRAAYLPGEICTASMMHKGWSCETFHEHMPVRGVPAGVLANKKTAMWWSAAQFEAEGITNVVITGQDGVARLYEQGVNPVAEFSGWGSEIASLHNGCGNGWQLLVTGKTDRTKVDSVRAVEIQSRQARDVSSSLELPGPVMALHAAMVPAVPDPAANASAIAIVRNLQTGRYEAYRLTITCGN